MFSDFTPLDVTALHIEPGLIVAQASNWLPVWLTPVWLISVGLVIGAIFSVVVFGLLAILSFFPGLGTLCDSPRRGVIASVLLGLVFAGMLRNLVRAAKTVNTSEGEKTDAPPHDSRRDARL